MIWMRNVLTKGGSRDKMFALSLMQHTDYLVIGSGVAGLTFALHAAKYGSVAVLTKRRSDQSNTAWAQGGVAAVMSEEDSFASHVGDTEVAGAGLCDVDAVREIVEAGPEMMQWLQELGVHFDYYEDEKGEQQLDLHREGAHSHRRILHHRDATGAEISRVLLEQVRQHSNIELYEHHSAIDLITSKRLGAIEGNRCVGVYVYNEEKGEVESWRSDRVVLATGGAGRVYQFTTNPPTATGDGIAMAWRAGAEVMNMEFVQFHPTCLFHPKRKNFLITEALRGEGAELIDRDGREFLKDYDHRGSLASRDIVSRAIDSELKRTGAKHVFLDATRIDQEKLEQGFPMIVATCRELGIDPVTEPIPVVPAAHYCCGGVRAEVNGATSLLGLYAVGEVACTGLHGANRLASNSLLEGLVMGRLAAEKATEEFPLAEFQGRDFAIPQWSSGNATDVDELAVVYHNWDEIRQTMWDYVSIVRTTKRLQRAATRLRNLSEEVSEFYWNFKVTSELLDLRNLVDCASLIIESAARRCESRGAHFTRDYPQPEAELGVDTVLRRRKANSEALSGGVKRVWTQ